MSSKAKLAAIVMLVKVMVVLTKVVRSTVTLMILSHRQWLKKRSGGYRLGYRFPSHISHGKFRHKCRSSIDLSPQKIFVDRIGFEGSPSAFRGFLAKSDIPRPPYSSLQAREVLTDAQTRRSSGPRELRARAHA